MAKTKQVVLTTTIRAEGAIVANRFVSYAGKQAKAGEAVLGVAPYDTAADDTAAVDAIGIAVVETGGALAAGDAVAADAQGCAVKQTGSASVAGYALDAAAAANDTIRIKIGG